MAPAPDTLAGRGLDFAVARDVFGYETEARVKPSPLGRQLDATGVARAVLVNEEREVEGTGHSFEEALYRPALKAVASDDTNRTVPAAP